MAVSSSSPIGPCLVLYPSQGMGHLISMVELAKPILTYHPPCFITILTFIPSFNTGATSSYVSATTPSITFYHLPDIPLDPVPYPSMEAIIIDLLRRMNPNFHRALAFISALISAFIIDLFCSPVAAIAHQLHILVYYFYNSGACSLVQFFYLPTLHEEVAGSFKDLNNTLVRSSGLPPIPASRMPGPVLDRNSIDYASFLEFSQNLHDSDGIILNTFELLEPRSIKAVPTDYVF